MVPAPRSAVSSEDLARAERLLVVRSRRAATGLFAGNYASAFRGSGMEFEESRPYAPGDDVSTLDWNASARTGQLFVKRYREERNQTLMFALDTSGSMGFGSTGRTKAAVAAHALALLGATASRAGDRTGLVCFDDEVRDGVPPGRGGAHGLRVIRAAVRAAASPRGATGLLAGLRGLRARARRRAVMFLFSDLRDPLLEDAARPEIHEALAELCAHHEVVAVAPVDPLERELTPMGVVRIVDPERAGRPRLLRTGSARVRARYREASRAARAQLETELSRCGAELLWLPTERSPLHVLGRFFRERASRRAAVRS